MDGNYTKSNKHLVLITPGFPDNESDANCLPWLTGYILALANDIGNENITVLSLQHPFKEGWYSWNKIKVYSAGGQNKKGIYRFFTFRKIKTAFQKIRKQHPDIVIHSCWLTATAYIGNQFSSKYGYPHIASIFGQDALPSNNYLSLLNNTSTKIIANSAFSANIYSSSTGKKADAAITIGINPNVYKPSKPTETQYDLVSVGNLYELKQYHIIVRLVEQLKIKFPKLNAAIAGDGPDKEALQLMIDEKGLNSSIHLVGAIPNPEILNFIRKGKVFIHPSRYEASSHAMLEANYAGLPVVCSKVGYYPTSGYVFQCDGYSAMHDKIVALLSTRLRLPPAEVPMIDETIRRYRELYQF